MIFSTEVIQPLFPTGIQKVLCVVRLPSQFEENMEDFKANWEAAQNAINNQHKTYALAMGFEQAVAFENDNFFLSQDEIPGYSSNSIEDMRLYASQNGLNFNDYDIYLLMDLVIENPSGGLASWRARFAKVGWFYDDDLLPESRFTGLAYAAYHHEIGHVWGWEHEWSDPFDLYMGFITDASLFGWLDIDGDGLPEILDETPYQ